MAMPESLQRIVEWAKKNPAIAVGLVGGVVLIALLATKKKGTAEGEAATEAAQPTTDSTTLPPEIYQPPEPPPPPIDDGTVTYPTDGEPITWEEMFGTPYEDVQAPTGQPLKGEQKAEEQFQKDWTATQKTSTGEKALTQTPFEKAASLPKPRPMFQTRAEARSLTGLDVEYVAPTRTRASYRTLPSFNSALAQSLMRTIFPTSTLSAFAGTHGRPAPPKPAPKSKVLTTKSTKPKKPAVPISADNR